MLPRAHTAAQRSCRHRSRWQSAAGRQVMAAGVVRQPFWDAKQAHAQPAAAVAGTRRQQMLCGSRPQQTRLYVWPHVLHRLNRRPGARAWGERKTVRHGGVGLANSSSSGILTTAADATSTYERAPRDIAHHSTRSPPPPPSANGWKNATVPCMPPTCRCYNWSESGAGSV